MDENLKAVELLLGKAVDYGKTEFELAKLRSVEKLTDVVSSLAPRVVVLMLIASFILFLNLGLAFWLGDILGKTAYGLLIVAGFYALCGIVLHLFLSPWVKRVVSDYFIKTLLK
jgi:hypothetical protein